MPQSYRKKPLAAWPDNKKHQAVRNSQDNGGSSISGSMPDPESDDDLDKATSDVGLYDEPGEKNQESNVAEEVEEAEKRLK